MSKTALITGVSGQDGSYLAKFLLRQGYRVAGTVRTTQQTPPASLEALGIVDQVQLLQADFFDLGSLQHAIEITAPDEIYNLAAQSSVAQSFQLPTMTGEVTGLGVARMLEALHDVKPDTRFYQASSSEMFGVARESPQTEETPFYPRSPYGVAKVYAHWMTVNYRESYGCHASCGILFNHESPLRPEQFVTRKVTQAVARIKHGLQSGLELGNLDVRRDWGFAGDYVEAMWHMLQQDEPDDYIISTGKAHALREFVEIAFDCVGLNYEEHVTINPEFFRPAEVNAVVGDNSKAKAKLGWAPRTSFERLVAFLVEAEERRVVNDDANISYTLEY